MIRIGICEDIREDLEQERDMVQDIMQKMGKNTKIFCFRSGEDLLYEIEDSGCMDIIFMDIQLEGKSGIEISKAIRKTDHNVILIFISLYDQYCKEAISVQPFAFVDKPVSYASLKQALLNATEIWDRKDTLFEFTFRKTKYCFLLKKISYFESNKRLVCVCSEGKTTAYYCKLDDVEKKLRNLDFIFLRINKSFLANVIYIREYHYDYIVMDSGKEIKIGVKYRNAVRRYCMEEDEKIKIPHRPIS